MKLKETLNKKKEESHIFSCFLNKLIHAEHGVDYIISMSVQNVAEVLFSFILTLVPGLIINELTGECRANMLVLFVALLAVVPITRCFMDMSVSLHIKKLRARIYSRFSEEFNSFVADMDYSTLEQPEISIMKDQVGEDVASAPLDALEVILRLVRAVLQIIFLFSLVVMLNPLIVLLIFAVIYVNSKITKTLNKKNYEDNKVIEEKSHAKWTHFYDMTGDKTAKELRIFKCKEYLLSNVMKYENELLDATYKHDKYATKMRFLQTVIAVIQTTAIYVYSVVSVVYDRLAIGSMTIFISAADRFAGALNEIVNVYLDFGRMLPFWKDIMDFLSIKNRAMVSGSAVPEFTKDSVIEFRNVSFRYPGSDKYALEKLNLKIYGSERLCIVGENGSGKTTFSKLLLRFYDPTSGEILLNGLPIEQYDFLAYQRLFTSVFQDFATYNLPLENNIALCKDIDAGRLENAIENSGLSSFVEKLPRGVKTNVLKNIDPEGVVPSGGEGQKIAIARALYHGGDVILLDEPTASLDPRAEYEIYCQFSNMIAGKCAVLITHRLSAVQLADTVAVFDGGHVAEYGTHKELYAKGGIYTEMFDKQAEFYRGELDIGSEMMS